MEKIFTAIGDFYNEADAQLIDVPENEEEIYAAVEEIMDNCPAGSVLTKEQVAILRAYLPAIGCDEATRDENYSLQGKGTVTKKAEGCGIAVEATGELNVESRWEQHHDRKQWAGNMNVKRVGGEAEVKELTFNFYYLSIGISVNNEPIVLFCEHYTRTFNDPYHLADFNGGGTAQASRFDISKHIQWGFYMKCTCSVRTDEGTLLV
ncbi:MAG TPA: hypothetical protein DCP91_04585 [Eggerthellaceae bacterium]|nr:hypothetical protein [Eggerthellaceae bacterium]